MDNRPNTMKNHVTYSKFIAWQRKAWTKRGYIADDPMNKQLAKTVMEELWVDRYNSIDEKIPE